MRCHAPGALGNPTPRRSVSHASTIPQAPTAPQAARACRCLLCQAAPSPPCRARPPADHLARYLDAYTAGQLTRAYMVVVLGDLVVIHRAAMIPGGAR
jgi:hypothetical protein